MNTPSQEDIDNQQKLLVTYRRTLAHLLQQQALLGLAGTPSATIIGIEEARNNIQRIKGILRTWNVEVTDHPDDNTPSNALLDVRSASINTFEEQILTKRDHEDWGDMPDTSIFYGRQDVLAILRQWILVDGSRVVGILGLGGIGKTALAARLSQSIKGEFDYVIWRSLRNAPSIDDILAEYILFLSEQREINLPDDLDKKILLLINYLRKYRCLLILDNVEAVLEEGNRAGHLRSGCEGYSYLFTEVGEVAHQSCLIMTSREKPKDLILREGRNSLVKALLMTGLSHTEGQQILKDKGLSGSEQDLTELVDHYSGNPLALKLISEPIIEVFDGNVARYLENSGKGIPNNIREVLDRQYSRISEMEKHIMYWLAIEREPVSLRQLLEDIIYFGRNLNVIESLQSLIRRSLVERSGEKFTLQNVVIEYITDIIIG